jgi:Protein of unknown function (DUF2798)
MKKKIAFAIIMGVVTTGIISFTLIAVNVGFVPKFVAIWLRSWVMAYVIAIPAILIIAPGIEQLVNRLFREEAAKQKIK